MKEIDISILSREPNNTKEVTLIIEPLAPLSMVTDLPGSYYKSQKVPSKKMLCGLIENIIGWRFSAEVRNEILKSVKRGKKALPKYEQGSTYKPLLMDYFDILENPKLSFESICFYDDLWNRQFYRKDCAGPQYANSYRNVASSVISAWAVELEELSQKEQDDNVVAADNEYIKNKKSEVCNRFRMKIPTFYPKLSKREYVNICNGSYRYNLYMDTALFDLLKQNLKSYNIGYLGNSEGWVNVKIEEK